MLLNTYVNALSKCQIVICLSSLMLLASCGGETTSDVEALAADKSATNVAVLFTGNSDGIPGVHQDPPNVRRVLLDPSLDFRFLVNTYRDQGTSQIEQNSAAVAKKMLSTSPNGTMFWYFSGHGSESGHLISVGGSFKFESVARAMRQARGDVAFKRLIVLIDACFAGNSVNGNAAISSTSGSDGIGSIASNSQGNNPLSTLFSLVGTRSLSSLNTPRIKAIAPGVSTQVADPGAAKAIQDQAVQNVIQAATPQRGVLYEQLVVIASSRANETSGDSSSGGVGTTAFLTAIKQLRSNPNARINDLLQGTVKNAFGQTPVHRVDPESVGNELLFGETQPVAQPTAVQPEAQPVVPSAENTAAPQKNVSNDPVKSMFNAGQ